MSFQSEFEQAVYEPWSTEYVAYKAIHDSLHQLWKNGNWTFEDENGFESAIRLEANKVDQFMNRKEREIETRINYCERTLSNDTMAALKQSVDNDLACILADIKELSGYTRINFKALENLIQEHDTLTHTDRHSLLVDICRARPLDSQRFDPMLVKVSSLIDICRDRRNPVKAKQESSSSIPTYSRYWVHADSITELKAVLLFNLPIHNESHAEEKHEQTERTKSIVYFDNNNFSQYTARLQRDDEAVVVSCQWTEHAMTEHIAFERRIYKKTNSSGQCISDSINIEKRNAQGFISGKYTASQYREELERTGQDDINQSYTTASVIQATILEKRLVPKVRVSFDRFLFKSPQDTHLSVSLDSHVLFTKMEDSLRLESGDAPHRFPYAILETRADHGDLPVWLSKLLQSKLVFEVPRFSLYLHGVAEFYGPQLALLPWWLSRLEVDIRAAGAGSIEYSGLSRSNSHRPMMDGKYGVGYLETQLDRKETRRSSLHSLKKSKSKQSSGYSSSSTVYNIKNAPSKVAGETFADPKETVVQIETTERDVPIYHTPIGSVSELAPSQEESHCRSKFIDYYNEKRNKKSEGYMLNTVDNINEDDALRQGAAIQIEKEIKQRKKDKKKKNKSPPVHTMEPKVFFANERTFINWLQFAALIMTAALTLLNFGDRISIISGGTFFGTSMVIALYAFFRYRYRAYQINTRPHIRYDDIYGPVGLTCLLLGAMALNFALRWVHPSPSDTYLGINNTTDTQNNTSP